MHHAFAAVSPGDMISMSGWRAFVTWAATAAALPLAGCGSGQPSTASHRPAMPGSPAASAPSGSHPSATPASGGSEAAVVYLRSSEPVPFTGDTVTLMVQAAARSGSPQWIRLAAATVALGDGTTATVTGPCAGGSLPPPSSGVLIRHVYHQAGTKAPMVAAVTLCGKAGAPRPDLAGASASLRVLPAAQRASASWPPCAPNQLTITATAAGAGLGHVGELFTLRNTSSGSCQLYGYPDVQLLASSGRRLPTTVMRAVTGAYLFPAVVPHRVALQPGAVASFDLQYGDNPVGLAADPDAPACPATAHVEVTVPNAGGHNLVRASMAPCGGQLLVSPVVPGARWLAP
jgi:hypothetical protein